MRYISVVTASMFGTLIAFGVVFFLLVVFVLAMAVGGSAAPPVPSRSTLVIPLAGAVPESVSGDPIAQSLIGESPYGLHELTDAIRRAGDDRRIDALWLKTGIVTMPWASLQAIRRAVLEFKASGKPVYASSTTYYMAEKEYYVASAADSVFLDPESVFEMNGFVATTAYYSGLLEKLHVSPQIVKAGSYKSAVEPYTRSSLSDENREQLQALLDDITSVFISDVATSRNLDPPAFRGDFVSAATFSAPDALDRGYLDGLLFDDEIRSILAERTGIEDAGKLRETTLASYARSVHAGTRRGTDEIAVVNAVGTMVAGKSTDVPNPLFGEGTLGSETFIKALRRARDNRRTKAVVIRINSPGGQAAAADAMLREIRETAKHVPVVVSMGDVAASGGFWIAMGASSIVAEPLTITGSIGVFSMFFDVSGLMKDHLGITYDNVKTGPYADMLSGLRPYRPEEYRLMEDYTDDTYRAFVDLVAEGRSMSPDDVLPLAGGRIWTGSAAVERSLVDKLGGLDDALALAAEKAGLDADQIGIRTYPLPQSFLERFSGQARLQLARLGLFKLDRAMKTPLSETLAVLETLLRSQGQIQARMPLQLDVH